ncbi:hypothetical protein [Alicyclobacillus fodiniaquatilis]|uniref:Uncharacterized protein n=1 Tax=Alicyclobacillus fodiniaquatilis TaxID=1661150 RepID=A0ABW4JBS8_9BACL
MYGKSLVRLTKAYRAAEQYADLMGQSAHPFGRHFCRQASMDVPDRKRQLF